MVYNRMDQWKMLSVRQFTIMNWNQWLQQTTISIVYTLIDAIMQTFEYFIAIFMIYIILERKIGVNLFIYI